MCVLSALLGSAWRCLAFQSTEFGARLHLHRAFCMAIACLLPLLLSLVAARLLLCSTMRLMLHCFPRYTAVLLPNAQVPAAPLASQRHKVQPLDVSGPSTSSSSAAAASAAAGAASNGAAGGAAGSGPASPSRPVELTIQVAPNADAGADRPVLIRLRVAPEEGPAQPQRPGRLQGALTPIGNAC